MKRSRFIRRMLTVGLLAAASGLITACQTTGDGTTARPARTNSSELQRAIRDARQAAAEARKAAREASSGGVVTTTRSGRKVYSPKVGPDMTVTGLGFPTGDLDTSSLVVHQVMPKEVLRGQDFGYEYHVTNMTTGTLQNVALTIESTMNLDATTSDVRAQGSGNKISLPIGDLGPNETRVIKMHGKARDLGMATNCIGVTYTNLLCAGTKVVEPGLKLVKTATRQALLCDDIVLKYVVSNPGSGLARNVRLVDDLPKCMTTADGKKRVERNLGDLPAGKSVEVTVNAKSSCTGTLKSAATATAAGGLTADSQVTTTLIQQPILTINANCPEKRYIGRSVEFSYTVKNVGNAPATATVVTANVPAGSTFASASQGGTASNGRVTWQLGTLAPNQSKTVSIKVNSAGAATLRSNASVMANCAESVTDFCVTKVIGIPAILLEVIDVDDPIEVGSTTTYVISVTNQGSAPGTNIRIVCKLPEELSFISASGATKASLSGRTITMAPIASLAPKEKAEWRIVVKATGEGDVRFAVQMNSNELSSPVDETEATNLYR